MKPIKYITDFYDIKKPDCVVASFTTKAPFMGLMCGHYINFFSLPGVDNDEYWKGKTLRIEYVENGVWEAEGFVIHKVLVGGKVVPKNSPYLWLNDKGLGGYLLDGNNDKSGEKRGH